MAIVRPTAFVILLASFSRKFGKTLYPGRDTIPYQWKGIVKGTVRRKLMAFNGPVWGYGLTLQSDQACSLRGGCGGTCQRCVTYANDIFKHEYCFIRQCKECISTEDQCLSRQPRQHATPGRGGGIQLSCARLLGKKTCPLFHNRKIEKHRGHSRCPTRYKKLS